MLKTTEAAEVPVDQPDYDEPSVDDPDTLDVDESERETDNEHVFIITVSDGTSSVEHEFTLTVTDVDDPAPGSNQKLNVKEDNQGGLDNSFGSAPALSGVGDFAIGEQIDNHANITLDPDDILFDVDAASGAIYLKANKAGDIDFESGVTSYTVSVLRGTGTEGRSGIVVISVDDVNEAPLFSASDKASRERCQHRAIRARVGFRRYGCEHWPGRGQQPDHHSGHVHGFGRGQRGHGQLHSVRPVV